MKSSRRPRRQPHRRTKIVCTLGPATATRATITKLISAGMDVARLNFSYGSHEEHGKMIALVREVAEQLERPVGILQDLSGPKLRVGEIAGGEMALAQGQEVVLSAARRPESSHIPLPLPEVVRAITPGARLLLGDGKIELKAIALDGQELRCRVRAGGVLKSHQGVNIPDVALPIRTVTEKDLADLAFGLAQGVDWVAMSFVRQPKDLAPLRRAMERAGVRVPLVAKIEKGEAIRNLDGIIEAADGVMVARGDLGIELPLDQIPVLQKEIISRCNLAGKPVVIATEMLASMVSSPRPTRAEVSDVANAVLDGADAVMLSAETATGKYPVAAVKMMARVAEKAEAAIDFAGKLLASSQRPCETVTEAISEATCNLAEDLSAAAIITATTSGNTARKVSSHRPETRIVAVTPDMATQRQLTLSWGVCPVLAPRGENTDALIVNAIARAQEVGFVKAGDTVVITAGVPPGRPGFTNLIKVEAVGQHRSD